MTNQHMPAYQAYEYMEWCVSKSVTEEDDTSDLWDQVDVSDDKFQ
jgi:hypothetical protein